VIAPRLILGAPLHVKNAEVDLGVQVLLGVQATKKKRGREKECVWRGEIAFCANDQISPFHSRCTVALSQKTVRHDHMFCRPLIQGVSTASILIC
jgi:hypothetical protein